MIEFKNVSKAYSENNYVLKDINIKINDGEFVFIVGHSGAGKTTLTKLLLREERVSDGRLIIDNFRLDKMRESKVPYLRRTMGFVFQDFRLFPNKTVYENVAFAMQVIGASNRKIKKEVPAFIEAVGLKDRMHAFPAQLSGGLAGAASADSFGGARDGCMERRAPFRPDRHAAFRAGGRG